MDTKRIEKIAIKSIENLLLKSGKTESFLSENDKTPCVDGKIILYKENDALDKKNIVGEIDVQVKGTEVEKAKLHNKKIKHAVKRDDLIVYRQNGGCLYFVVAVLSPEKVKIYYKLFLPLDLEDILSKLTSKSKTLEFCPFPTEVDDFEYILKMFIDNSRKQQSTATHPSISIKDLKEISASDKLVFYDYNVDNKLFSKMFFTTPKYVYLKNERTNIHEPLLKVHIGSVCRERSLAIKINDKIYYKNIYLERTIDELKIKFGHSFTVKISLSANKITAFNINLSNILSERILDIAFLIALYKYKNITIGNITQGTINEIDGFNLPELNKMYSFCNEFHDFFCKLRVKKAINLDIIQPYATNLLAFKDAITNHNDVNFENQTNELCPMLYTIGDFKFLIIIERQKNGKYKIYDFFDNKYKSKTKIVYKLNDEEVPASTCVRLDNKKIFSCDNIDYDFIKNDVTSVKYTSLYATVITSNLIFSMLLYYDDNSNSELLDCVIFITKWLYQQDKNDINFTINYFQSIKRKRPLADEEIGLLIESKVNISDSAILWAIHVLLDNKHESLHLFKKSESENKLYIKEWPEYNLYLNLQKH